jgi:hypothetical protein
MSALRSHDARGDSHHDRHARQQQPTVCRDADVRHIFSGYRICSGRGGYRSTEWERDGMRFGEDSDGNRWTTSRWRDMETTTVRPPDR